MKVGAIIVSKKTVKYSFLRVVLIVVVMKLDRDESIRVEKTTIDLILGIALANEIIQNVPTQGRNPFQIAWAASGVIKSGSWRYLRSFDIGGTSGISINGGREKTNEVLLDGISDVRAEYTVISIPTTESVQEFKVQSNTYDAQYGRTGGGVITIVTKGGTNEFHGTAFEYFQNDKLNANQSELNTPATVV